MMCKRMILCLLLAIAFLLTACRAYNEPATAEPSATAPATAPASATASATASAPASATATPIPVDSTTADASDVLTLADAALVYSAADDYTDRVFESVFQIYRQTSDIEGMACYYAIGLVRDG